MSNPLDLQKKDMTPILFSDVTSSFICMICSNFGENGEVAMECERFTHNTGTCFCK